MYNKDDVIYILENNTTIRKGKIARKQGDNYIIQLIGSCGALTMPEDQLFESEEAAEKSRQQIKLNSAKTRRCKGMRIYVKNGVIIKAMRMRKL